MQPSCLVLLLLLACAAAQQDYGQTKGRGAGAAEIAAAKARAFAAAQGKRNTELKAKPVQSPDEPPPAVLSPDEPPPMEQQVNPVQSPDEPPAVASPDEVVPTEPVVSETIQDKKPPPPAPEENIPPLESKEEAQTVDVGTDDGRDPVEQKAEDVEVPKQVQEEVKEPPKKVEEPAEEPNLRGMAGGILNSLKGMVGGSKGKKGSSSRNNGGGKKKGKSKSEKATAKKASKKQAAEKEAASLRAKTTKKGNKNRKLSRAERVEATRREFEAGRLTINTDSEGEETANTYERTKKIPDIPPMPETNAFKAHLHDRDNLQQIMGDVYYKMADKYEDQSLRVADLHSFTYATLNPTNETLHPDEHDIIANELSMMKKSEGLVEPDQKLAHGFLLRGSPLAFFKEASWRLLTAREQRHVASFERAEL